MYVTVTQRYVPTGNSQGYFKKHEKMGNTSTCLFTNLSINEEACNYCSLQSFFFFLNHMPHHAEVSYQICNGHDDS